MKRRNRVTVFLSDEELESLESIRQESQTLASLIRQLAGKQAKWYVDNGHKVRPALASEYRGPGVADNLVNRDGTTYDYSDSQ